jgi:hypothetical protein
MPTLNDRRIAIRTFSGKQNKARPEFGVIGDGQGLVEVPGSNNLVYVRIGNRVQKIKNVRVAAKYGETVSIGIDPNDPGKRQVLSVCTSQNDAAGISVDGTGPAPAKRYEWMANGGGQDPLYVHLRQFRPLRISCAGGLYVSIQRGFIKSNSGIWLLVPYQTINMASHLPTTAGKALLALVTVDQNGTVVVTAGAESDIADLTDLSSAPAAPANTAVENALVRLYYGQTAIQEMRTNSDIFDIRMPYMYSLTSASVGLGNVTNDAQLKRSGADWDGFTEDAAPSGDDWIILEKGASAGENAGEKRKAQMSNIPGAGEGSFNLTDGINTVNNVVNLSISGGDVYGGAGEGTITINKTSIGLPNVTDNAQFCQDGSSVSDLLELTSLADADKVLVYDQSAGKLKYIQAVNLPGGDGGGGAPPYFLIQERQSAGTNAGASTSGSFNTRVLNTIVSDDNDVVVSLSSNKIILAAGTYIISARVPACASNQQLAILYDVTNSADLLIGSVGQCFVNGTTWYNSVDSIVSGKITVAANVELEIRQRVTRSQATYGLGIAANLGKSEIYTSIEGFKVS